jgi:hypothetical protein
MCYDRQRTKSSKASGQKIYTIFDNLSTIVDIPTYLVIYILFEMREYYLQKVWCLAKVIFSGRLGLRPLEYPFWRRRLLDKKAADDHES